MARDDVSVDDLLACLAGRPCADLDWTALVDFAHQQGLSTALAATLSRVPGVPPAALRSLAAAADQNALRNLRIVEQVSSCFRVLNEAGIRSVVFKGGGLVLSSEFFRRHRMLADIDLLVEPSDVDKAVDALGRKGYRAVALGQDHAPYILVRDDQVAAIDLHVQLPGPKAFNCTSQLMANAVELAKFGTTIRVPSIAYAVYINVIHDDFHMGYYFRKMWSLKHVADIFLLQAAGIAVNWRQVSDLARNTAALRAVAALEAVTSPEPSDRTMSTRLETAIRDLRMRSPWLGQALTAVNLARALVSPERDLRKVALDTIRSRVPG
jgi:hypothetical protein